MTRETIEAKEKKNVTYPRSQAELGNSLRTPLLSRTAGTRTAIAAYRCSTSCDSALLFGLAILLLTGFPSAKIEARDPSVVGDKWVIRSDYGGYVLEETREVTEIEVKDGALFVTTLGKLEKIKGPGKVVITKRDDTGEYLLREGEHRYDPPIRVMPKPVKDIKAGDRWQWEKPGVVKWTFTAGKEEEVEVPAGKFKARRIEGEGQSEGRPVKCTQWVVPGHPTIKSVIRIGDGSRFDDGEVVEVLKSFTLGKK